jgi:hypothetical protein
MPFWDVRSTRAACLVPRALFSFSTFLRASYTRLAHSQAQRCVSPPRARSRRRPSAQAGTSSAPAILAPSPHPTSAILPARRARATTAHARPRPPPRTTTAQTVAPTRPARTRPATRTLRAPPTRPRPSAGSVPSLPAPACMTAEGARLCRKQRAESEPPQLLVDALASIRLRAKHVDAFETWADNTKREAYVSQPSVPCIPASRARCSRRLWIHHSRPCCPIRVACFSACAPLAHAL